MITLAEEAREGEVATFTLRRRGLGRLTAPLPVALLVPAAAAALVYDAAGALDRFVTGLILFAFVAALSFGVLGWLLAWHRPENRLGTVATSIACAFALTTILERYAMLGYPRDWLGTQWALWGAQWTFVPTMWSIPTVGTVLGTLRIQNDLLTLSSTAWETARSSAMGRTALGHLRRRRCAIRAVDRAGGRR